MIDPKTIALADAPIRSERSRAALAEAKRRQKFERKIRRKVEPNSNQPTSLDLPAEGEAA